MAGARGRGAVSLALMVVGLGCSSLPVSRSGNAAFEAGDFATAAQAWEELVAASPELPGENPDLSLRLALAHAVPDHAASDLGRARQLLEALAAGGSNQADSARALLAVVDSLRELRHELERAHSACEVGLRQCEMGSATSQRLLGDERRLRQETEEENARLRRRVEELEGATADLERRLRTLAEQLEAIKQIDLERRP